jgi:hypothetical protein
MIFVQFKQISLNGHQFHWIDTNSTKFTQTLSNMHQWQWIRTNFIKSSWFSVNRFNIGCANDPVTHISLYDKDSDDLLMSINEIIYSIHNDSFKPVDAIGEDSLYVFEYPELPTNVWEVYIFHSNIWKANLILGLERSQNPRFALRNRACKARLRDCLSVRARNRPHACETKMVVEISEDDM